MTKSGIDSSRLDIAIDVNVLANPSKMESSPQMACAVLQSNHSYCKDSEINTRLPSDTHSSCYRHQKESLKRQGMAKKIINWDIHWRLRRPNKVRVENFDIEQECNRGKRRIVQCNTEKVINVDTEPYGLSCHNLCKTRLKAREKGKNNKDKNNLEDMTARFTIDWTAWLRN